jgi:CheY-like chemotaxis protein
VQERQAIDRSRGGLGIGLTIVRSLVERHGGTVSAKSDGPGRGSEFVIRLPRAARGHVTEENVTMNAPAPAPVARAHAPRILVVDDNEDAADLLAEALTRRGYDIRVAHDAPTALQLAPDFAPDVAFLDIGLPVMDGYELATHLRGIPSLRGIRLVAITGYGQESDFMKARQAGFHLHLVKPVAMEAIEAAIAEVPPHAS